MCLSLIFQWNHQELKHTLKQAVSKEIGAWSLLTQMKPFPFGAEISQRFHSNTQLSGMCLSGLISDGFYTKHTAGKLSSHFYISCGFESIMKHSQIVPQNFTRVRIMEKPGQCSKNWLCKAADTTNIVNFKRERRVWRRKEEEKVFQNISNEACLTIIAAGGEVDFKCENI